MTLERSLTTIGKSTFIKYYYNFKHHSTQRCICEIEENYTDKSKSSRVAHAKSIFRQELEIEALKQIIKSDRVDYLTRQQARQILFDETKVK